MKPSGSGRILLRRGGSLWIGRSAEPTDFHSHHSIQIAVPFSPGGVRFRRPGRPWTNYPAAIIAGHEPHAYEARGASVAMLFVEPESREGQALQARGYGEGIAALATAAAERERAALVAACQRAAPDAELIDGGCSE